jgi:hypothetical protein
MRWVVVGGALLWLAVLTGFAAAVMRPAWTVVPVQDANGLVRQINASIYSLPGNGSAFRDPGWRVTSATSVRHIMLVNVEAGDPGRARQIAIQIVEPVKEQYDEVLVYVHKTGAPDADRRIQWTPRGGYVEILIAP